MSRYLYSTSRDSRCYDKLAGISDENYNNNDRLTAFDPGQPG